MSSPLVRLVCIALIGGIGVAAAARGEAVRTAAELGLMVGSPPPVEKRVTYANLVFPPYNRWGLMHLRELVPTRSVPATGPAAELPYRAVDLASVEVVLPQSGRTTVGAWLESAYTDGFIVLHGGDVVFERYWNGHDSGTQHLMFSATKSFTGTMMLELIEEGRVDAGAMVKTYIPELAGSAFGDATVQQMLDMTNSIDYDEDYSDPESDISGFLQAMSPEGEGLQSNLLGLRRRHPSFEHGEAFHYVTPDPEVLGWIIRRVTGVSLAEAMGRSIWSGLGAAHEGYYWLDYSGVEMAGGGLAITLPDAARFGQMILDDGRFNGRQVITAATARRIKTKRNAALIGSFYDEPWYGEVADSYHDQWWGYSGVNAVAAIGVYGQFIYINSDADVVIAKQTSDTDAESLRVDTETALVMHAIASYLDRGGEAG